MGIGMSFLDLALLRAEDGGENQTPTRATLYRPRFKYGREPEG
jgi:hypothetical protein